MPREPESALYDIFCLLCTHLLKSECSERFGQSMQILALEVTYVVMHACYFGRNKVMIATDLTGFDIT